MITSYQRAFKQYLVQFTPLLVLIEFFLIFVSTLKTNIMKKLYLISIMLLISFISFGQKTWTGSADNNYHNPANWDPSGTPTASDVVEIPYGSPTCEVSSEGGTITFEHITNLGTLSFQDGGNHRIVAHTIENVGTMNLNGTLTVADKNQSGYPVLFNYGTIQPNDGALKSVLEFDATQDESPEENTGMSFTNEGFVKISSLIGSINSLYNSEDGVIVCDDQLETPHGDNMINIKAIDVFNEGGITGGTNHGVDVSIIADQEFRNTGTILGGHVTDNPNADLWDGGSVILSAVHLQNSGTIRGGAGGQTAFGGKITISGTTKIYNTGTIESGYSHGGYKEILPNDVTLSADSVILDHADNMISGFDITVTAEDIVIKNLNGFASIISENDLTLYTIPGGTIDLSGLHVTDAIFSLGAIYMYSDNIIPPTEGIGEVCDPDPTTDVADDSYISGHIQPFAIAAAQNSNGTVRVYLNNNSTDSQVLTCDISSELGWVSNQQINTASILPFENDSIEINYNIPVLTEDAIDVVEFILSINGTEIDTTYSYISSFVSSTNIFEPTQEFNQVYPNPFKNYFSVGIQDKDDFTIEVIDKTGKVVFIKECNKFENKIIMGDEYRPGVYFIRTIKENKVYLSKIVKI